MSFLQKFESRWDAARLQPVSSAVPITARASEVWWFLLAPESALLTGDGVARSFRIPGTPTAAPGEQQCVVSEVDGLLTAHIAELVVVEPASRMVIRWLTMPGDVTNTFVIEENGASHSLLSCRLDLHAAAGSAKAIRPELQAHLDAVLGRVRAALEAGVRFPTHREDDE